jgi:hypothetical protein
MMFVVVVFVYSMLMNTVACRRGRGDEHHVAFLDGRGGEFL